VPAFLIKIKHQWPNLKTIVHETSNYRQIEMLLMRGTDIGIAPNILVPPEIETRVLYKENFALLLPERHPLAKKRSAIYPS
jgi:DNA-binding transcriptional LysR family regulator